MILDTILAAFVRSLLQGFSALYALSLPLFGAVAVLAWLRGSLPLIRARIDPGEVWAAGVLMCISIVIYLILLDNLQPWAIGIFEWSAELGARVGRLALGALLTPSAVLEAGAASLAPIRDFLGRMEGVIQSIKNLPTILNYSAAYLVAMAAFAGVALNIAITIIMFYFALLSSTVLVPWAPLAGTAFLAEFSLAWLAGTFVRMFIQTAVVGISVPLFEILVIETTVGGDPLWWESIGLVVGAVLFFLLSWIIPNQSVNIAGRLGGALGVNSADILSGFGRAARGATGLVSGATRVASGVSSFVRAERASA